jgi:hypothetical protein
MNEIIQRIKLFLLGRKQAYQLTFRKDDKSCQIVLQDLAKFCRANQSTFNEDPRAHAVLEGRREVWLRIQNYLNLSDDELYELYGRKDLNNV